MYTHKVRSYTQDMSWMDDWCISSIAIDPEQWGALEMLYNFEAQYLPDTKDRRDIYQDYKVWISPDQVEAFETHVILCGHKIEPL